MNQQEEVTKGHGAPKPRGNTDNKDNKIQLYQSQIICKWKY
jgi:hypothetical protein